MQITLNIDSANIGGTIEQVFFALTSEEKKELARSVMLQALSTPMSAERDAFERKVVDQLIAETANETYHNNRITNVEEARKHYKYRERMAAFKSSSERMVEEITRAAIGHYKEQVTEMVKEDEQLNKLYEGIRTQMVANFPNMVQAAMASHFASQMGQLSNGIMAAYSVNANLQNLGSSIQQQLSNNGIHISVPQPTSF
jgi:hypothetical protein